MPRHFWKLLAAVALAPGLALAGAGAARADVVPPAGTWAEIFAPEVNANGITLCIDDPAGSTAQFQALQLWRCHGYASNGIPQRWTFYYAGSNSLGPAYRIANTGGSNWCIGLTPHPSSYAAWYGTSLVQEACSSTTGSEVVWNLVPATQSPDPDNQFMLISTYVPFGQQPYCISASSWTDENGTRLVAKPCDPSDSRQFWALG